MRVIKYVGSLLREMFAETQRTNKAYAEAYRRCFEGTPEEVARRLDAWDYVHEVTRSPRTPYF